MSTTTLTQNRLLEHARWLRELAHHLVLDPHDAEDLAQETVVTALEHPPASPDNPRGWLRVVLENRLKQRRRSDHRRQHRELLAARTEELPDTVDVINRAARHREVVEAIFALAEPFRTAILLRYFDGLRPREIARRQEVPIATVSSRLHRGLAQLRKQLDRRHGGDRATWSASLLTIALHEHSPKPWWPPSPASWAHALVMTTKSKTLVAAAIVLGVSAYFVFWSGDSAADANNSPEVATHEPGRPAAIGGTAGPATGEDRKRIDTPAADASRDNGPTGRGGNDTALHTVRGRVFRVSGEPGVDVAVALDTEDDPKSAGRSDAQGVFLLQVAKPSGTILASGEDLVTVRAGVIHPGYSIDPVVIVAEKCAVGGTVRDPAGQPIANAVVSIVFPNDALSRFKVVLDSTSAVSWRVRTDAAGMFRVPHAPRTVLARMTTAAKGFVPAARPMIDYSDAGLRITLQPVEVSDETISGQVIDAQGLPVADAFVSLGLNANTTTDAVGMFQLRDGGAGHILAVKPGHLPGKVAPEPNREGRSRWPDFAVVQLAGKPRSLTGRVVDESGAPVPHARVWIANPTPFGLVGRAPARIENLLSGAPSMADLERDGIREKMDNDPRETMNSTKDAFWSFVETDRAGHFELPGLLPQPYTLEVMDKVSMVRGSAGPFDAGTRGIEITLRLAECHAPVEGHVVSQMGKPIPGVTVIAVTEIARAEYPVDDIDALGNVDVNMSPAGPTTTVSRPAMGAPARTNKNGRFRMPRLPKNGVFLAFRGDSIVSTTLRIGPGMNPAKLVVKATLRLHIKIELDNRDLADAFAVHNADGEIIDIFDNRGDSEDATTHARISEGKSRVYSISEAANEIVFFKDRQEVSRKELVLEAGKINVIR